MSVHLVDPAWRQHRPDNEPDHNDAPMFVLCEGPCRRLVNVTEAHISPRSRILCPACWHAGVDMRRREAK